jgi:hypothetical protein
LEETLQVIESEETFVFDEDPFSAPQSIPVNEKPSEATADETQRKRGKKRKRNSRKNIGKPRSKKTDKVSFPRIYSILMFNSGPGNMTKTCMIDVYNLFDVRVYSR